MTSNYIELKKTKELVHAPLCILPRNIARLNYYCEFLPAYISNNDHNRKKKRNNYDYDFNARKILVTDSNNVSANATTSKCRKKLRVNCLQIRERKISVRNWIVATMCEKMPKSIHIRCMIYQ